MSMPVVRERARSFVPLKRDDLRDVRVEVRREGARVYRKLALKVLVVY